MVTRCLDPSRPVSSIQKDPHARILPSRDTEDCCVGPRARPLGVTDDSHNNGEIRLTNRLLPSREKYARHPSAPTQGAVTVTEKAPAPCFTSYFGVPAGFAHGSGERYSLVTPLTLTFTSRMNLKLPYSVLHFP